MQTAKGFMGENKHICLYIKNIRNKQPNIFIQLFLINLCPPKHPGKYEQTKNNRSQMQYIVQLLEHTTAWYNWFINT